MAQLNDWLSIDKNSGTGNAEITLTASSYEELIERTSTLKVQGISTNAILTVKQEAFVPKLTVLYSTLSFEKEGGELSNIITSNTDWYLVCDEWVSTNKTIGSKGETEINISVGVCIGEERNGTVKIYAKDSDVLLASINIEQSAYEIGDDYIELYVINTNNINDGELSYTSECLIRRYGEVSFLRVDNGAWKSLDGINFNDGLAHKVDVWVENTDNLYIQGTIYKAILKEHIKGVSIWSYLLEEIDIPNSTIDVTLVYDSVKKLNIPSNCGYIDMGFSTKHLALEEVTINNPDYFEDNMGGFNGAISLHTVITPNGLTKINRDTFRDCKSLKNITLEEGLTYIGETSFKGSGITSITIPSSVTAIGSGAFNDCPYLTHIYNLSNVSFDIEGCPNLVVCENNGGEIGLGCEKMGSYVALDNSYIANAGVYSYRQVYGNDAQLIPYYSNIRYYSTEEIGVLEFTNKGGSIIIPTSEECIHPWWITVYKNNDNTTTVFLDPNYFDVELEGKICFSGGHYSVKQAGGCDYSYRNTENVVQYVKKNNWEFAQQYDMTQISRFKVGLGEWQTSGNGNDGNMNRGELIFGGYIRVEIELMDNTTIPVDITKKDCVLLIVPNTVTKIEEYSERVYTIFPTHNVEGTLWWGGGSVSVPKGITTLNNYGFRRAKIVYLNNLQEIVYIGDMGTSGQINSFSAVEWGNVKSVGLPLLNGKTNVPSSIEELTRTNASCLMDYGTIQQSEFITDTGYGASFVTSNLSASSKIIETNYLDGTYRGYNFIKVPHIDLDKMMWWSIPVVTYTDIANVKAL